MRETGSARRIVALLKTCRKRYSFREIGPPKTSRQFTMERREKLVSATPQEDSQMSADDQERNEQDMTDVQKAKHDLFLHQDERAEVAFKRILEDFPNHPLFYHAAFQLGILNEKKKDLQGASHFYGIVLKGNLPELIVPTYFRIGEILIKQEKEEKALASFKAALPYLSGGSPWFDITQLEIGNLQSRWGTMEEAQRAFQRVQDQSRDEEIKSAAKELLHRLVTR